MDRKIPVSLPEGYLDFYKSLESWQNEQQVKLSRRFPVFQAEAEQGINLLYEHKSPLIKLVDFKLDEEAYRPVLESLLLFLGDHRPELENVLKPLCSVSYSLDLTEIAFHVLNEDEAFFEDFARQHGISPQLAIFIFDHALRPFLRIWAEPLYEELRSERFAFREPASICPVCGSRSHISRLRKEDGRRFMFCDRCFSEWETRYLYCVHCGNDKPGSIRYLSIQEDQAYQLYVCDECKGYLKTYDERQFGVTTDLFIANVETIYLDILASEHGYGLID